MLIRNGKDDNAILRTWDPAGELADPAERPDILPHHEVLLRLDAMDLDRGWLYVFHSIMHSLIFPSWRIGAKIAGHRGYYLTNDGVDLNQALILYGLDYLRSKQYKKIQPPFFMNKDQMAKTAQLDQFDEELYKVHICLFSHHS